MGGRDINLDGAEVTVVKALGLAGTDVLGEDLIERCPGLIGAELIDTIRGLVSMGYVDADRSFHSIEELKSIHVRVNSGYSKDLKEALDPSPEPRKSKRVRRE